MREDEDTKIICEAVEPCPSEKILSEIKTEIVQEKEKKKAKGLFLRFDTSDTPQIECCRKLLAIFDGNTPLYYYFSDSKKYKKNPLMHGIDVNTVLLRELRKMFRTVLDEDCFVEENVVSLKRMGNYSFLISLVTLGRLTLYLTPAVLIVILVFLIAGLFSKVLSKVFERAIAYKLENDLTI